ncbi:beta-glucuronosyltransferase GlcAT14B-like [Aristolochia californica]|uniref:beta-glucuronosyltransferase GlcAT14B-like n=1 Tax=Aristolochia californica TaxID=171875 RepID=UPI0035E209E5
MNLHCDNKAAIAIAHNPVQHDRTKHVEVDRHFIKENLDAKIIQFPFIQSESQLTDTLTKAVSGKAFHDPIFIESKISSTPPTPSGPSVPRFAYLLSGSKGDLERLWRTLRALYHPLNQYIIHLDLESSAAERLELADRLRRDPMYSKVENVHMITKANMVTYRGPTMVANTLHACAMLLRKTKDWDWFINLSASDYPLVTQDDLLYTFSDLPKDLNFIEHTSKLGWKEGGSKSKAIDDGPWGLYKSRKQDQ